LFSYRQSFFECFSIRPDSLDYLIGLFLVPILNRVFFFCADLKFPLYRLGGKFLWLPIQVVVLSQGFELNAVFVFFLFFLFLLLKADDSGLKNS